ncbi:uncharacterized protein Z518_08382 [Rhinocladiella mackenziei CBS 650.93]|uniref:Rhinocladiella mackenziei CBS 650.93 unplaced genomic scaffold supercont1.6, whole genome shotgun sequence n=1 Tax=Rhinocladiella mackenziei CBS 650.93 TaxID=1442369 RepID=A0A0D2IGP5_9EURO|nr:uncharacterized protein Z518_08382 [Rhinocladiella mackenziei CBS 650.93]KIX02441.1 hypothetical protein Z518_08382 [Rhinocladiella mackenziei CBS 650.93]
MVDLRQDWLYDQGAPRTNTSPSGLSGGWSSTNLDTFLGELSFCQGDLCAGTTTQAQSWNAEEDGSVNRTVALEWALALIIVDALSRTGSGYIVDINDGPISSSWTIRGYERVPDFQKELLGGGDALKRPEATTPTTEGRIDITIGGYSYRASSLTDYLSIALFLTHIVLASCHVIFMVGKGQSSSAWDSISELLVLAQNSRPPTKALRNTNAGIQRLNTYSQIARLYVVKIKPSTSCQQNEDDDNNNVSNVELIFDEEMDDENPVGSQFQRRKRSSHNTHHSSSPSHSTQLTSRVREDDGRFVPVVPPTQGPRKAHVPDRDQGGCKCAEATGVTLDYSNMETLTKVQADVKYGDPPPWTPQKRRPSIDRMTI